MVLLWLGVPWPTGSRGGPGARSPQWGTSKGLLQWTVSSLAPMQEAHARRHTPPRSEATGNRPLCSWEPLGASTCLPVPCIGREEHERPPWSLVCSNLGDSRSSLAELGRPPSGQGVKCHEGPVPSPGGVCQFVTKPVPSRLAQSPRPPLSLEVPQPVTATMGSSMSDMRSAMTRKGLPCHLGAHACGWE